MYFRSLCFILLAFAFCAAVSFGNTNIAIYYYPPQTGGPLTISCSDSTPLPPETIVYVFEDIDNDGPDFEDPLLQLAAVYPDGESHGYGANENRFEIGMEGYVALNIGYGGEGNPHLLPVFLRIFCGDGGILWESRVFEAFTMTYNEFITTMEDWTCYECAPYDLCEPTRTLSFEYIDGTLQEQCAYLCSNLNTWAFVTGLEGTYETPVVEIAGVGSEICSEFSCSTPEPSFEPWHIWEGY